MQDSLFSVAERLRKSCRYGEALGLYRQDLSRCRRGGDRRGALNCLISLGDTYRMVGNFSRSIHAYTAALPLSKELRDSLSRADALTGLGLAKRALADWKSSLRLFREAETIYKKKNDRRGLAFIHWARGGTYRVGGKVRDARRELIAAEKMYVSFGSDHESMSGRGYCLCSLGGLARVAGSYEDSMHYYRQANTLLSSQKDRFGTAYSFCGIGNAYRMLGEFSSSLRYLKKAERLYQTLGDMVSYSYTLWSMGMLHLIEGDLSAAENCFTTAGKNFKKTKDARGVIYSSLGKAQALIARGRLLLAKRIIGVASEDAARYQLSLEACHARLLLAYLQKKKIPGACYKKVGSTIRLREFPFNIP